MLTNLPASERAAEKVREMLCAYPRIIPGDLPASDRFAAIISSEFAELVRLGEELMTWAEFQSGIALTRIPEDRAQVIFGDVQAFSAELQRVGGKP